MVTRMGMFRPEWEGCPIPDTEMALYILAGLSKPVQCGRCLHVARGVNDPLRHGGDLCECCFIIVDHSDSLYNCDGSLIKHE